MPTQGSQASQESHSRLHNRPALPSFVCNSCGGCGTAGRGRLLHSQTTWTAPIQSTAASNLWVSWGERLWMSILYAGWQRMRHVLARPLSYRGLARVSYPWFISDTVWSGAVQQSCIFPRRVSCTCALTPQQHRKLPATLRKTPQHYRSNTPQHTAPKQGTPPNNGHFASHRATSLAPLVRPTACRPTRP